MAKKTDKKIIVDTIKAYLTVLKENKIIPKKVYLYGSYSKGNFHKDSDIDIAIVSDDFTGKIIDDQWLLLKLCRKIDLRLEPHPFLVKEFDKTNPLVREIIETGIEIK